MSEGKQGAPWKVLFTVGEEIEVRGRKFTVRHIGKRSITLGRISEVPQSESQKQNVPAEAH